MMALDLDGLDVPADVMQELLKVDVEAWRAELPDMEAHFEQFGDRAPAGMKAQVEELRKRLG
ncbi:hypothetical protein LCGC14_2454890 [marine sediment metagenome]|uniref:Phosphoenolpyruvate carboxykinase C-terminal P-loop domain-containing protein n=1 Tax=marine sediment metagenome TaxID=412755 RepID=A0A0F9BFH0_9ZZZZ